MFFIACRPFRADQRGEDWAVPRGLPSGVRALYKLPQAQHSPLLAQAADEGDRPAHDRGLPRQPFPSHEGRVSQWTVSPALPGGVRGPGSVTVHHPQKEHFCGGFERKFGWRTSEDEKLDFFFLFMENTLCKFLLLPLCVCFFVLFCFFDLSSNYNIHHQQAHINIIRGMQSVSLGTHTKYKQCKYLHSYSHIHTP